MRVEAAPRLHPAWLFACLAFIIYGSLVPLDFHPHSLAWAWEQFQQTPMLKLGIDSRADWIANGVLYFPAGFLLAERFVGRIRGLALGGAVLLSIAALAFIAFGVEFTQLFFPPRTVSQNDLLAETIGGALGVLFALPFSNSVRRMAAFRPAHGALSMTLLLRGYMVAYLAYCFFPFDFLLSGQEISEKLASDHWGLLFAASPHGYGLRTLLTLALEVAAVLPFGVFIARRHRLTRSSPPVVLLLASGLLLGLAIEVIQFFTYTAVSQGISVLTRTLGVYAGGMLWARLAGMDWPWRAFLQRHWLALTLFYLLGLALFTGWAYPLRGSIDSAQEALGKLHFLPFYYHYYVSEANALTSLVSVALLFAPLGILAAFSRHPLLLSTHVPATAAALIESAKLFSPSTHADPTNILIAVAIARATAAFVKRMAPDNPMSSNADGQPTTVAPPPPAPAPPGPTPVASAKDFPSTLPLAMLSLVLAGVTYWLIGFPVQPLFLAVLLLASAVAVWVKPVSALAIIPAALPILDLAPWSGRFYLDEFDILLAVTLAVGYARTSSSRMFLHPALKIALTLLALSIAISTLRALIPWHTPDANAFSSYFSPFNALRISKGFVWALLFIRLAQRLDIDSAKSFHWFARGMTFGLAAVVAVVIREKILFGGLLDFSSDYRATGPFSAIHTGGAYIEAYLVAAVPFLIFLTLHARNWLWRLLGPVLLLGSTYALMATISRSGFAAYAIACGLAFLTALAGSGRKLIRLGQAIFLGGAALAVAIPLMSGSFVQQRMSSSADDLFARQAHWADGLAIREDSFLTEIFGMGIGRFPITHYLSSRELGSRTSIHSLAEEPANTFMRIAPGNTLYVEQIVALEPQQRYLLRFDFRSTTPGAHVGIGLCEKWMLASHRCATLLAKETDSSLRNGWQALEYTIESGELGSSEGLGKRPVKLSFYSTAPAIVDIDNIRLAQAAGPELIANGDFSQGMDHWYFATDHDLAWHLHSTPIAILFDQGWFGLLAWGAFATLALGITARAALRGNPMAGISAAAMVGYGVVSLLGAVIDAPRFLFLCIVLATLATHQRRTAG